MKRALTLGCLLSLCGALWACATLKTSTGSLNIPLLLTDAQFGISAACSEQWLQPDVCALATDAITVSQALIAKDPTAAGPAVKKTLQDVLAKLPANNRLTPYLAWLIAILA